MIITSKKSFSNGEPSTMPQKHGHQISFLPPDWKILKVQRHKDQSLFVEPPPEKILLRIQCQEPFPLKHIF